MNVIVIYHHPQECGDPYLAFISQQTGKVVETVDLPTGYWSSGFKRVDIYTPVYSFIEQVNQSPRPTVDNVRLTCSFYPNPKHYIFRVTKVDNIKEDNTVFPTWIADVRVEACRYESHWEYDPTKDTFLQQMTESGFDMSHWELPIRQKTEFLDFLKQVASSYKDYHLINLIEIS
jgi:hypothetical protein